MPGMSNQAKAPVPWLNRLIGAASNSVKRFCKRDLEMAAYDEPYSGAGQRDLVVRQFPVWMAQTGVTGASDGATLPQATIDVLSTKGFHPGTGGDPNAQPPAVAVQIGPSNWTWVTYTGTTPTNFTGCTLGGPAGTMAASYGGQSVSSPVVFYNSAAFAGQAPGGFFSTTNPNTQQMVLGTQFYVETDSTGGRSNRGLLRRIGGSGAGFIGFYPENFYSGKLAAYRMPVWPRGDDNVWVKYTAGFGPAGSGVRPMLPDEIVWATAQLVAYMVRNMPSGASLSSENLGSYSYNVLQQSTDVPELGSIAQMLKSHRESSWGI